jgi:hypothetical protein
MAISTKGKLIYCTGIDAAGLWTKEAWLYSIQLGEEEMEFNDARKLLQIVDLWGRSISAKASGFQIWLYSDGSVEKYWTP